MVKKICLFGSISLYSYIKMESFFCGFLLLSSLNCIYFICGVHFFFLVVVAKFVLLYELSNKCCINVLHSISHFFTINLHISFPSTSSFKVHSIIHLLIQEL